MLTASEPLRRLCATGGPGATVTISNRSLRGSSVELGTSLGNADNGLFTLKGTDVTADGDEFTTLEDIFVRVSDAGHGGSATLHGNTFRAGHPGGCVQLTLLAP